MNLEGLTKKELIELCQQLQGIAQTNKDAAERAAQALEECTAYLEKEGMLPSDAITLSEH